MLKQVETLVKGLIKGSPSRRVLAQRLMANKIGIKYSEVKGSIKEAKERILHAEGERYHNEAAADHFTRNIGE